MISPFTFTALFFFIDTDGVYEMFVLIQADKHSLDIVVECSNHILQIRSDYVMDCVERHVLLTIFRATKQLRRDKIWDKFRLELSAHEMATAASAPFLTDVNELCEVSCGESILKHLVEAVFVNADAFHEINWRTCVLPSMEHDHGTFAWTRTWSTPNASLVALTRFRGTPEDTLIMLLFDRGVLSVKDIFILCKERGGIHDVAGTSGGLNAAERSPDSNVDDFASSTVPTSRKVMIIELFSNWLIRWIWRDIHLVEVALLPEEEQLKM